MRGHRRYRAQRRPRIPPSASIAPVAQHRGGNAQLACDLAQRPTAAHQQGYRFLLELIRKMSPSLAHSTPFRSRRSLAKVSTNSGEPHNTFLAFRQRHPADRVISRTTWAQTGVPLSLRTWVKSAIRQVVRLMPIAEGGSWRRAKTACRVDSLSARRAPLRLPFVNKASTPLAVNTRTYFLIETRLMERDSAIVRIGTPRTFAKTAAAFFR